MHGDVAQQLSYVPWDIHHGDGGLGALPKFKFLLREALKLNRNLVISSEGFDRLNVKEATVFKQMVAGFDVTVVFVYREWLSLFISWHSQMEKSEENDFTDPFSEYLMKHMDNLEDGMKPLSVLDTYEQVFGANNVHVVDYYGTHAAGVDIAYAVLCKVGGVLCTRPELFINTVAANTKESLVTAQLYSQFRLYMRSASNCNNCPGQAHHTLRQNFIDFYRIYTHKPATLPIVRSSLKLLHPYAEQQDNLVEEKYGERMVHANHNANTAVREKEVHVEEVDLKLLWEGKFWLDFCHAALQYAQRTHLVCGCGEARAPAANSLQQAKVSKWSHIRGADYHLRIPH